MLIMSNDYQTLPIHIQNMLSEWQHINVLLFLMYNIHQPEEGMVVLLFLPNLVPQLGCYGA